MKYIQKGAATHIALSLLRGRSDLELETVSANSSELIERDLI